MEEERMNYKYEIVRAASEKGDTLPFGMKIVGENGKTVSIIPDISADEEKISKLAELCNTLELEPIHFYDVICDFLASENTVI